MPSSERWKNSKLWIFVNILVVVTLIIWIGIVNTEGEESETLPPPIYKHTIQRHFEKWGWTFQESIYRDGTPYLFGTSRSGGAAIDLIGPDNTIRRATIVVDVNDTYAHEDVVDFMDVMMPDWEGRTLWLLQALKEAGIHQGGDQYIRVGTSSVEVQARRLNDTPVLAVTVHMP